MRLFSYVGAYDTGFAPHVQDAMLSLATCKPRIRASAQKGDWIAGTAGRRYSASNFRLVYLAEITEEPMPIETYDRMHPERRSSPAKPTGDSIYYLDAVTESVQQRANPWHGPAEIVHDLGGRNVLLSRRFVYFGPAMPDIPADLDIVKAGPGHRSNFSQPQIEHVISWVQSIVGPAGWNRCYGVPNEAAA